MCNKPKKYFFQGSFQFVHNYISNRLKPFIRGGDILQNKFKTVCLFFFVHGEFLVHRCSLENAEEYGDYLVYPQSHFEIWDNYYYDKYNVDFDYFPRGRVAYNKISKKYHIYFDRCIEDEMHTFIDASMVICYDEHYQCHKCNKEYVI